MNPATPDSKQSSFQAESAAQARRSNSRFLRACRRQPVDTTPVWLMRQAGRYQPEFREIRARTGFLELCKSPPLSCEVTIMAVDQLAVDAAIIFADILLLLEALGVGLEYVKGEGPLIHRPIKTVDDVGALRECCVADDLGYVMEAITLTRQELRADIPLIGFAGAPFTLASYLIEGGSSSTFHRTKTFMYECPEAWDALLSKLSALTISYLQQQVQAGADALQLFDSWAGALSPADYERFVYPYSKRILSASYDSAPLIHFATGCSALIPHMVSTGGQVIGVDWRTSLRDAWDMIGPDMAIQGNLDPAVLLSTRQEIAAQASRVLREAGGRKGHIFNLGHGVLQTTKPAHARFLVDYVHEHGTGNYDC